MTLEQRFHALAAVPEFRDLPTEARAALAASMREEAYAAGEVVIVTGDPADRVYVLCDGVLTVTQEGRSGVVRRLERGALLGELAFFADAVRTATVRAEGACVLLSLHFDNFRAFLLANPASALILAGRIVRTLRGLELTLAEPPPAA